MSYLDRIQRCNNATLVNYFPLQLDGYHIGWVRKDYQNVLMPWLEPKALAQSVMRLNSPENTLPSRNQLLATIVETLHQQKIIRPPMQELYPVSLAHRNDVIALVDRVSASFFGIRCYGQHLNGYVRDGEALKMWVGRRARDRGVEPGKLDQLVAGGLPHGISPADNLLKECYEEAGISKPLAEQAKAVGTISYFAESSIGLKPDTLYNYDLALPVDFHPQCTDGEVEDFYLMPLNEVADLVRETTEFKLNCNLVVIDFLVRHGVLAADEIDYTPIVAGLHPSLPVLQPS